MIKLAIQLLVPDRYVVSVKRGHWFARWHPMTTSQYSDILHSTRILRDGGTSYDSLELHLIERDLQYSDLIDKNPNHNYKIFNRYDLAETSLQRWDWYLNYKQHLWDEFYRAKDDLKVRRRQTTQNRRFTRARTRLVLEKSIKDVGNNYE